MTKPDKETALNGYRPLTEGYQPSLQAPLQKGYTPPSATSTTPPKPPSGGSSAAKPAAKQA